MLEEMNLKLPVVNLKWRLIGNNSTKGFAGQVAWGAFQHFLSTKLFLFLRESD